MRFYGLIGFATEQDIRDGITVENKVVERMYIGDIKTNRMALTIPQTSTNTDVLVFNIFSIRKDSYIQSHLSDIRYVNYKGTNWKVTGIEIAGSRIELTVGGVYNGATTAGDSKYSGNPGGF